MLGKSLLPQIKAKLISPAIKTTAETVGSEQWPGQASIASCEDAFEKRRAVHHAI